MNSVQLDSASNDKASLGRIPLPLKLSLVTFLLMWGLSEALFRMIGFDFNRSEWKYVQTPIYYRMPRVPYDTIYFRRPGPASWTGKVLQTGLRQVDPTVSAYTDEKSITVTYDKDGFRNPADLQDWDVAMVGDSFVELGYLPYEELISTELGRRMELRVRNLGMSHSGPMSYLAQLRNFGKAPSNRYAIMVFFEGNDLKDLKSEMDEWRQFQRTGKRPFREVKKQTSLTLATSDILGGFLSFLFPSPPIHPMINADFHSATGSVPVSIFANAPSLDDLPSEQRADLTNAFKQWSTLALEMNMEPWVVLMPSKPRILFPRLTIRTNSSRHTLSWKPNNLPTQLREAAESQGNKVIDLTPGFEAETAKGRLIYNGIYDTHVNREGSLLAAKLIAQALASGTNALPSKGDPPR